MPSLSTAGRISRADSSCEEEAVSELELLGLTRSWFRGYRGFDFRDWASPSISRRESDRKSVYGGIGAPISLSRRFAMGDLQTSLALST